MYCNAMTLQLIVGARVRVHYLPHEMMPPRPHNTKYLVEPNSQESLLASTAAAAAAIDLPGTSWVLGVAESHLAWLIAPLNGDWREASNNELNIMMDLIFHYFSRSKAGIGRGQNEETC